LEQQAWYLFKNLLQLSREHGGIPIIVCIDANSKFNSDVVNFLTKGCFEPHDVFLKSLPTAELSYLFEKITLPSVFNSVYPFGASTFTGSESDTFTTFTPAFTDTIDYIFTTTDVKTTQILQLPTVEDFTQNGIQGLPNEVFPSDHLALVADLLVPVLNKKN
jgi:mRNA deadenylase 3'-5' endonuclease subunit Ccr4